jgi:3-methyl-2-oxobutanoate hydroxymethyltransferase
VAGNTLASQAACNEIAFPAFIANNTPNMHAGIAQLGSMKARGEKIAVLTAYDYPTARLLDESGIDLLLVGDSVGMVVLGYPDTTLVTLDEMLHHTRAVARGARRAPIMADLPIATYDNPEQAVSNARQLIDAGAHAVKLEGGASHVAQIRALVQAGIPVMPHIGMQPQSVRIEGGYRMKGKTREDAERLLADAHATEEAGAFGLLMELVHPETAHRITDAIKIPTIGIGAGPHCDGQVLVTHDLIGLFPWFTPKFVAPAADVSRQIREAASEFLRRVKSSTF